MVGTSKFYKGGTYQEARDQANWQRARRKVSGANGSHLTLEEVSRLGLTQEDFRKKRREAQRKNKRARKQARANRKRNRR